MLNEDEFYRGISASTININKKEYTLACGFVGVEFINEIMDPKYPDEVAQSVRPGVGWVVYEADPSLIDNTPRVFICAETSGSLF